MPAPVTPYAPSARLTRLRTLLSSRWCTLADLQAELSVSESTARRMVRALETAGEPVEEQTRLDDGKKQFRVVPTARTHTVRLTTTQLVALVLARNALRFLQGTGFDEDLESLYESLVATLRAEDAALAKNIDRKLYDVSEQPVDHSAAADVVDDLVTAILREEKIALTITKDDRVRTFAFEPYTLAVWKKGLYVIGLSGDHGKVIKVGLDIVTGVERKRGEKFAYPADYRPEAMFEGSVGMRGGERVRLRARFDKGSSRFVTRRKHHPTQRFEDAPDGAVDLVMDVNGTDEMESYVLSYAELAEVIEPKVLRRRMAERLAKAAERYAREPSGPGGRG